MRRFTRRRHCNLSSSYHLLLRAKANIAGSGFHSYYSALNEEVVHHYFTTTLRHYKTHLQTFGLSLLPAYIICPPTTNSANIPVLFRQPLLNTNLGNPIPVGKLENKTDATIYKCNDDETTKKENKKHHGPLVGH